MIGAYAAELIGTFALVFGGVGSAVIAGSTIGPLGVSLAFGLSLLAMVYAVGRISGCHVNPAVTVGLAASGRFAWSRVPGYLVAQTSGSLLAAWLLYAIATGGPAAAAVDSGFAANGYGAHSPDGFSMGACFLTDACFLTELVLTFLFVFTVLQATNPGSPSYVAGLPIGLGLALIHLVGIPVTNTSVNPARSVGPATVAGGWAMEQLWMFWVAPILGALVAALTSRILERAARVTPAPALKFRDPHEPGVPEGDQARVA